MISVEFFKPEKHYEIVAGWWKAQNWPIMPLEHLPQTGIIVTHDEKPAAAAWIYKTDSAFCLFEWIVANPEVRHEARAAVLSVLISTAKMLAQTMGFKSMFLSSVSQSLGSRVSKFGFAATDTGVTNYICNLGRD